MANVNWENIDELRQIFIDRYTESKLSTELEKSCSEEYELMRDYNGRQILELLQNVDDACENINGESNVYIKFLNNILEVGNTGTTFSRDTIERLCLGRSSSKSSANIGNKGTGFRSLLNDAEWIEIHSGEFSIRFSYEYTKSLFEKYVNNDDSCYCKLIADQLNNWKKEYPLCFPVLNCPERIEKIESEFDTLIRVKVKDNNSEKITSIYTQLYMPFYKSILFLPHITKIVIETNSTTRKYEKCADFKAGYDEVLIKDNTDKPGLYYLFKKQAMITEGKYADLMIAYPVCNDFDFSKEKLYCYFPIRNFQTPIHALIHAPFITNNSRDDVPNDNEQINQAIFVALAKFIKEVAEKLKDLKDTNPIEFVTPVNFDTGKMWDSDFFDLKNSYLELLYDANIIPTVNDDFISINDGPRLLESDFPDEFKGEGFEFLVKKNSNPDVYKFIKNMCSKKDIQSSFESSELSAAINLHSNEYDIATAVKVFLWWSRNYRTSKLLPMIIKDTNNRWIQKEFKVFLPTNDGISVLDRSLEWVKLCVIKQEYVSSLIDVIKREATDAWEKIASKYSSERTNEKRLLDAYSDTYLAISFTEQSSSRVIISEILKQVNSIERSLSFFNWFFENYKDKMTAESELSKLKYLLPDKRGDLRDTKNLYFGDEYGNTLAEKIFDPKTYYPICGLKNIYNGKDEKGFLDFIRICGVLSYPQSRKINLYELYEIGDSEAFIRHIKAKYNFNMKINHLETYAIDNFKKLLLTLSTEEIVELLSNDLSLSSLILSTERQSTVKQQINWTPSYFNSNEYVMFLLNNTKWIEIDGVKYSPKEIIFYDKLKDKIESIYGIREKALINLLNEDIVKRFNIEFKNDFSDFSDKEIYDILNRLPEIDTGEISRSLYTDILRKKKDREPEYNPAGIKLIAKDGKFHINSELIYVDRCVPQIIESSRKVDIPVQMSTKTIKNWFGVEKLEMNYSLLQYTSIDDFVSFSEEFKNLKVCILAVLDDTTPNYISKLQRMKVIPCSKISALESDSNHSIEMADYSFIYKEGSFYFKLPSSDMMIVGRSHEYAMSFIEMFKEAVSPQIPMDLTELLIGKDHKERRLKIEEKYGIDKWNTSYEALFEKSSLSKMIIDYFRNNGLSEDLSDRIENVDFSSSLSDEDYSLLFKCLNSIDKDICNLNSIHDIIKIDATTYIKKICISSLGAYRDIYKSNCFLYLKNSPTEQLNFLKMMDEFDRYRFEYATIENSVHFSPLEPLKEAFNLFDKNQDIINVDAMYNEHYRKCIEHEDIDQVDFDYYIEENMDKRSLLYFDSYEEVIQSFLSSKNEMNIPSSNGSSSPELNKSETSTIQTFLIPAPSSKGEHGPYHYNGEFCERKSKEINEFNENAGREAENIAYAELKKSYHDLIWNSKYTKIPADKNNQPPNGIVCDMWNKANEGNAYFEVKSSVSEFEMSINEYESMKNNPLNYYVVLVDRETKEISLHQFKEVDSLKKASKYKFVFKQQKSSVDKMDES